MRRHHHHHHHHHHHGSSSATPTSPRDAALSVIRAFEHELNPTRPARPSPLAASVFRGMPLDLVERVRAFPLFASAPDSFLAAIGSCLRPQPFSPQETILNEGDEAKAMYWLVRGAVNVTSRDRESVYAELKPGAFFGEIGILMGMPRTASIVARQKSLVLRLNKEDLQKELPKYPDVERAIREEAAERLAILNRKKRAESAASSSSSGRAGDPAAASPEPSRKRSRDQTAAANGAAEILGVEALEDLEIQTYKKHKSPSPGLVEAAASSALNSGLLHVRQLLKELPLFSTLPDEILHFLGLNAQQKVYAPFTDIIKEGTHGREVYFIVDGEVEVFTERPASSGHHIVKARLRAGQYFGEVVSLSLAPRRTADVRTITRSECLMISGEVLDELWRRCSPDLRRQMEATARARLEAKLDRDVVMEDAHADATSTTDPTKITGERRMKGKRQPPPPPLISTAAAAVAATAGPQTVPHTAPKPPAILEPFDPDPFLAEGATKRRPRSRRASLATIPTDASPLAEGESSSSSSSTDNTSSSNGTTATSRRQQQYRTLSPFTAVSYSQSQPSTPTTLTARRPRTLWRQPSHFGKGTLSDAVLEQIFQHLDIYQLLRLRQVSPHWRNLLSNSPNILHTLDLSRYNRRVTDEALIHVIVPFVRSRPRLINMSNCFHITDAGFGALVTECSANVRVWKMKSVWEIGAQAVLDMANRASSLEEIDFSNCRKVSDSLLGRVVGWIVRDAQGHPVSSTPSTGSSAAAAASSYAHLKRTPSHKSPNGTNGTAHNGIVGCPSLSRLTLSYCKHISDRSMAHLALHASNRLESINLTRCTTITDIGFQHWSVYSFPRLRKLVLADCTYLSDNAIVYLTHAAKELRELDLSFCCALSDTATEVLSLGCPQLTHLNLAFCGSAVSDTSMRSLGLHLSELRELSVRGCVRVTGQGVEAVLSGCSKLRAFDVSQCKNLKDWLDAGGVKRWGGVEEHLMDGVIARPEDDAMDVDVRHGDGETTNRHMHRAINGHGHEEEAEAEDAEGEADEDGDTDAEDEDENDDEEDGRGRGRSFARPQPSLHTRKTVVVFSTIADGRWRVSR